MSASEPETPKPDNAVDQELSNEVGNLKAENETFRLELEEARSQLAAADRLLARKNQEIQAMGGVLAAANQKISERDTEIEQLESKIQNLESQLAERDAEVAAVAADREELAQLKKEAKEAAAEIHREGRSIELEKARWQGQISDAKSELADAKATILAQGNKIRELERGYSFKPNPKESALHLEIGELRSQLADLQQNSAPASELPEAGDLLSRVRRIEPRNKKEKVAQEAIDLPIIKLIQRAILELVEGEP